MIEPKWDEWRILDFGNDRRRLERLKTGGMVLEKQLAPIHKSGDWLTPMGKRKRGKAHAATSWEIIFLRQN